MSTNPFDEVREFEFFTRHISLNSENTRRTIKVPVNSQIAATLKGDKEGTVDVVFINPLPTRVERLQALAYQQDDQEHWDAAVEAAQVALDKDMTELTVEDLTPFLDGTAKELEA